MSHFFADLLFDGERWAASQYFHVDEGGMFRNIPAALVNPQIKSNSVHLGVVIPGFINCHSHSFQRAMAGLGERITGSHSNDSFWTWREQMYRLAHWFQPKDLRVITDWLYLEMLESGYTSVGEFHYLHKKSSGQSYHDPCEMAQQIIDSARESQIRLCLLPAFYQKAAINQELHPRQFPFGMNTLSEYQKYHQILSKRIPPGFNLGVAIHSIRAVEQTQLKEFSLEYGMQSLPIHIHIAEQTAEVEESLQCYGKRPVEFLLDNIEVNSLWTLVHATHITPEERKGLAQSRASVGICPITEANLGDGIFPMKDFLSDDGNIAVGSDSHIRIDPFEELRWIEYSQRYQSGNRACLSNEKTPSPGQLLASKTYQGGQQSLMLNTGFLKDGFFADFLVLDKEHPSMLRLNPATLWDEIVFAGSRELVQSVYTGGKQIVYEGRHSLRNEKLESLRKLFRSPDFPSL
ncbi:MAG: formimidoylglutamate deiminase [SAR324 cluster bacterium]|nr:formimidoylglutamate deiminase [SAR324 cluster bacterium]